MEEGDATHLSNIFKSRRRRMNEMVVGLSLVGARSLVVLARDSPRALGTLLPLDLGHESKEPILRAKCSI